MKKKVEQGAEERAAKFLERAKNLDFNSTDVKVAAAVAGLGLAAVATYLASKKLGNKAKTEDGEDVSVAVEPAQYMEGVASFVREGGDAASFPMGDEVAAERLSRVGDGGIFIIDGPDIVRSPQADPRYLNAARWAISFARHILEPRAQEDTTPGPDA